MTITADNVISSGPSARSYLWDVSFPGFGGLSGFNFRCSSSGQPSYDISKVETNVRAFTIPESGAKTWNDITFELIENNSFDIITQLFDAGLVIWDDQRGTHTTAPASTGEGYTQELKIMLNQLDGTPKVTWTMHNCVLTGSLELPTTTSDKEGIYTISFTVSYAYATRG